MSALFCDLIGNARAKELLFRMWQQKNVPAVLLFTGHPGVGKSLFARELAQALLGAATAQTPDLHIYGPEMPMAAARELIDEMGRPPFQAPCKVFILEEAHRFAPVVANALLKTLEEPASDSYIFLVASSTEKLIPTIVSRCYPIPFFPVAIRDIALLAERKWGKTAAVAEQIGFLAAGSVARAYALAHQENRSLSMLLTALAQPYPDQLKSFAAIEEMLAPEEEGEGDKIAAYDALLEQLLAWMRDLHLLKGGADLSYLFHKDRLEQLTAQAQSPLPSLEQIVRTINCCRKAIASHVRLRVCLEYFVVECFQPISV